MRLGIMNVITANRPDLLAVLEDRGFRATRSRRDVIDLIQHKDGGFSVEEISRELPGVGRATVYRTIRLLVETGALCKLALADGAPKYSLSPVEHHHHTVCVDCGAISTFRNTTIERAIRAAGNEISGEIVGHRMDIFITCERCVTGSTR